MREGRFELPYGLTDKALNLASLTRLEYSRSLVRGARFELAYGLTNKALNLASLTRLEHPRIMLPPGFGPGSQAREACMIDQLH